MQLQVPFHVYCWCAPPSLLLACAVLDKEHWDRTCTCHSVIRRLGPAAGHRRVCVCMIFIHNRSLCSGALCPSALASARC